MSMTGYIIQKILDTSKKKSTQVGGLLFKLLHYSLTQSTTMCPFSKSLSIYISVWPRCVPVSFWIGERELLCPCPSHISLQLPAATRSRQND